MRPEMIGLYSSVKINGINIIMLGLQGNVKTVKKDGLL